ncbi:MAG: hypothetical protein ACD_30C00073G0001, partial [uncultured bacterium]
ESEGDMESLTAGTLEERSNLIAQIRAIPTEAITRMQFLQPQIGCLNRCGFCSQSAGNNTWQLDQSNLKNLFSAIKTVATEIDEQQGETGTPLVGAERTGHRPGVIFPYMDNDIFSYPLLYEFTKYTMEDLRAKVRVSTVGYSRHNNLLQTMHERINEDLKQGFAGVRFSFTPYTHGWVNNPSEYIEDFSNALETYRPLVDYLGVGKETACVEFRTRPLAVSFDDDLGDQVIKRYHCVSSGPYLLVGSEESTPLPLTAISYINNGNPVFSQSSIEYFMIISNKYIEDTDWKNLAETTINYLSKGKDPLDMNSGDIHVQKVVMYKFENSDGPYYAVDPDFQKEGFFRAKHFYPKTDKRQKSGYMDSERYLLNTLLSAKQKRGLARRDEFSDAAWHHADEVITQLGADATDRIRFDRKGAIHILEEVIPMVEAYYQSLRLAGYPPAYFFSRNFTIDTGQIVNQGRAIFEFKGLVSGMDIPVTPREERGFGNLSISSMRGRVWRWAPSPNDINLENISTANRGRKNTPTTTSGISISQLDTRNLSEVTVEGENLPKFTLEGIPLTRVNIEEGNLQKLLPGLSQ